MLLKFFSPFFRTQKFSFVKEFYKLKNRSLKENFIKNTNKYFKQVTVFSGKHLSRNAKIYASLLAGCFILPARTFIAVCDSKSSHSRIIGINSIEKLHQEAKFDWKKFFSLIKSEVWYILCAVVVRFTDHIF